MALARRLTYSPAALSQYFNHISLPAAPTRLFLSNRSVPGWGTSSDAVTALATLQKYQQARIPFANLYLHYSRYHQGTLDPVGLYAYLIESGGMASEGRAAGRDGIVSEDSHREHAELAAERSARERKWDGRPASGGRGGSCTVNNGFYGTVMRSLGMQVKSTGARVAKVINGGPPGVFGGWDHLVHLVEFGGQAYLVDVGFGANGPTGPLELADGLEMAWGATGDALRVIWTSIPQFEHSDQRVWVLQHRREGQGWTDCYCFTENEFLPQDIEVQNFRTTRDPKSFFNQMVICVKTVMEGEDVVGTLSLVDGRLKRRVHGKSEVLGEWETEVERWEGLEKWFGIVLGDEERAGIRFMSTELKGKPDEETVF